MAEEGKLATVVEIDDLVSSILRANYDTIEELVDKLLYELATEAKKSGIPMSASEGGTIAGRHSYIATALLLRQVRKAIEFRALFYNLD